jgi:hypothetical protein
MIVRTFTTWALILPVLVAGDDFLKDYRRLRSREVKTAAAMHFERTLEDAANVKPLEADAFFRLLQADTSMTPAPTRAPTRAPTNPPVPGATPYISSYHSQSYTYDRNRSSYNVPNRCSRSL